MVDSYCAISTCVPRDWGWYLSFICSQVSTSLDLYMLQPFNLKICLHILLGAYCNCVPREGQAVCWYSLASPLGMTLGILLVFKCDLVIYEILQAHR